ncbi:MAG: hypothetical protein LUG12_08445 [Erysipelotrichaceae bacterium]|nr:hypothetical protein [Erysipelotrichaceae bacterium]
MQRKKRLSKAISDFVDLFEYFPNYPDNIDFDQIEFAKELEKCVEDHFDYTIEKYGTIPKVWASSRPEIIYD